MKIDRKVVPPAFVPVTLTFETLEELTTFVDRVGKLSDDKTPIPYFVWDDLTKITRGNFKS